MAAKETKKAAEIVAPKVEGYVPTLQKKYKEEIVAKLQKDFGFKTVMQVPKLEKITINQGMGQAVADKKLIEIAQQELTTITGQKAVLTYSKKDISNFKLRKGMPIGVKVTLRGSRMYEFLDRFISVAIPRVRDFRGLSANSFDGRGNYAVGMREQLIFPEIDYDKIDKIRGMDIVIVTTANTDEEAKELLVLMGIPFEK